MQETINKLETDLVRVNADIRELQHQIEELRKNYQNLNTLEEKSKYIRQAINNLKGFMELEAGPTPMMGDDKADPVDTWGLIAID